LTGLDVLERGKKKKNQKVDPNNYYSPPVEPTAGPIDPEPETTTEFLGGYPGNDPDEPDKPDKPDKPNQYGGGSSGAYGDPHFHIVGISESQPDLCFDYNAAPGQTITLINDSKTGFKVTGTLFQPDGEDTGIYFESVKIKSPHGTEVEITGDDWVSSSPATIEPSYSWDTETLKYGDLYFGRFQKKGGTKGSKQMDIMIPSIGSFQVQVMEKHDNVNFKVVDATKLENVEGLIGRFLSPGAYQVQKSVDGDANRGFLVFNNKVTEVHYQRHAWNKNCWTMSEKDFIDMY